MAYCVHCGVKLGPAEKKCPLCGVPSLDPLAQEAAEAEKPFPVHTKEQSLKLSRRYVLSLFSLLLLLPAGLCVLLDMLGGPLSWSVYPAGALLMVFIAAAVPLLFRRHRLNRTIVITGAALAGYLCLVEAFSGTEGWFLPIVLPALAILVMAVCLLIHLYRRGKASAASVAALALCMIGVLALVVELLCMQAGVSKSGLAWSPYVMSPCFFIALLILFITRNRALYDELLRRFHV